MKKALGSAILLTVLFLFAGQASAAYKIVLRDGRVITASEYFEDGPKLVYKKGQSVGEVPRSLVIRISEAEDPPPGVSAPPPPGRDGKAAKKGPQGHSAAKAGSGGKPIKKKLTGKERAELERSLADAVEYRDRILATGPKGYMAEATIAANSGHFVTSEQIYKGELARANGRIEAIKAKLRGEIVLMPR